jgi:hypothetical protein
LRVLPTPASVGYVRAVLRDDLAVLPEPVREEVALIATELLGNAVRHARALDDGQLSIAWGVGDHGEPGPTDTSGRGLSIVATLAARWGVEQHDSSTTVWAVVPLTDRDWIDRELNSRDSTRLKSRESIRIDGEAAARSL